MHSICPEVFICSTLSCVAYINSISMEKRSSGSCLYLPPSVTHILLSWCGDVHVTGDDGELSAVRLLRGRGARLWQELVLSLGRESFFKITALTQQLQHRLK